MRPTGRRRAIRGAGAALFALVAVGLLSLASVGAAAAADPGRPARRSRTRSPGSASTTTPASFSPDAIADAEATIDAIEARTGAEVVVYTQRQRHVRPDHR